ncbi:MAG: hypothetical protein SR3Q1_07045 [Quinella sp. 3Q1]|nr:hypothetical protein [Quinella sp. 3Q1]MBR6887435.1 thioredoxin [Selenomonadaceae bacterium]
MNSKNSLSSRLIIFVTGAAMIWFGIERGELSTIFAKATRVCLECIGLG